jgi:hypothetical protein
MARYIDADALIEMCERMTQDPWNKGTAPSSWADAYDEFISDILRQIVTEEQHEHEVATKIFNEIAYSVKFVFITAQDAIKYSEIRDKYTGFETIPQSIL